MAGFMANLGGLPMELVNEANLPKHPELTVLSSPLATYASRTQANAESADLTVAIALDFSTAGERLTRKAAGENYLALNLKDDPLKNARLLYKAVSDRNAIKLNVAGNSIHRLIKHRYGQSILNRYVFEVLQPVAKHWRFAVIMSGGQSGIDIAGSTAAWALGLHTLINMPAAFLQRDMKGVDHPLTEKLVRQQVTIGAQWLKKQLREEAQVAALRINKQAKPSFLTPNGNIKNEPKQPTPDQDARQTPAFMPGKDSAGR